MALRIAVDIGGTFTDLVALDEESGRLFDAKSLTTPADLVQGIMACIRRRGLDLAAAEDLVHGSTIAINTVIEETGARTALVTTRGMRDVYLIGRGNRPEAYNLFFHRPRPLVPRTRIFEVDERLLASGEVLRPIRRGELEDLAARLRAEGVEAVAVTFLHAYANAAHERAAGEVFRRALPGVYVSLSSDIVREFREYERTSTTVLNAYVGPKVTRYLNQLERRLAEEGFTGSLSIMQSSGGVMTKAIAASRPVNMMESGPVGGIIAAAEIGRRLGLSEIVAFDMGGTTAKASLITDGIPALAEMYHIGGYASGHPVMIPVVDVVEVGTGGGSIAWIDEVGTLRVGPQSAGADPGPIAYRRGGVEPTITDANVLLGRIGVDDFLGGEMELDAKGAASGLARVGARLGLDALATARAVVEIAIYTMSLAVRQVSVEKGFDPRDFALLASGGAGPLHAVAIARELHIPTVVVPRYPAHFSAFGMLLTDHRLDLVRTYIHPLAEMAAEEVLGIYEELVASCRAEFSAGDELRFDLAFDMRYTGQEFTLTVPVAVDAVRRGRVAEIRGAFDAVHARRYGHQAQDEPVEVVNVRVAARKERRKPVLPPWQGGGAVRRTTRPVYFGDLARPLDCPVYDRETLPAGFRLEGPALVREYASTTVVFPGDVLAVAPTGELVITVGEGEA